MGYIGQDAIYFPALWCGQAEGRVWPGLSGLLPISDSGKCVRKEASGGLLGCSRSDRAEVTQCLCQRRRVLPLIGSCGLEPPGLGAPCGVRAK